MNIKTRATIEDLYKVEGKAELVHGEIICMSPTGGKPGRTSLEIAMSLRAHERQHGGGYAFPNSDPEHPVIFRRGDIADAEPAVPGWRMAVNDLFE